MGIKEYQEWVARGIKPSRRRVEFLAIAFAGEVGEALNEIKHFLLDSEVTPGMAEVDCVVAREAIKDELGDVLWYYVALCSQLGYSVDEIIDHNVKKLEERYGKAK